MSVSQAHEICSYSGIPFLRDISNKCVIFEGWSLWRCGLGRRNIFIVASMTEHNKSIEIQEDVACISFSFVLAVFLEKIQPSLFPYSAGLLHRFLI